MRPILRRTPPKGVLAIPMTAWYTPDGLLGFRRNKKGFWVVAATALGKKKGVPPLGTQVANNLKQTDFERLADIAGNAALELG